METYDIYCLLPADAELAAVLDALFCFNGVVYHSPDGDLPIRSSREALETFAQEMQEGEFIRFVEARPQDTKGGWLYQLENGAAVVGVSVAVDAPRAALSFLRKLAPNGQTFIWGDQPPPDTTAECVEAARAQRNSDELDDSSGFDADAVQQANAADGAGRRASRFRS